MNQKPNFENNRIYTGYEENPNDSQQTEFDSLKAKKQLTSAVEKAQKKTFKFMLFLAIPFSLCFFGLMISIPNIFPVIAIPVDTAASICAAPGLIVSCLTVRHINTVHGKNVKFNFKHSLLFTVFSIVCTPLLFITNQLLSFLCAVSSVTLMIWSFFIYTPSEKKIFLPIMLVSLLLNLFCAMYAVL